MTMGNALRFGRSAVVAAAVLCLAAAAHTAAGGTLPHPAVVLALAALTWLPVMILAGRRLAPATILAVLAGGQVALHQAFELFGTVECAPAGSLAEHAGPRASPATPVIRQWRWTVWPRRRHTGDSPGMLAAHLLATALTALMLARGEAALWELAAWLRPLVQLPAVHCDAGPRFPADHRPGSGCRCTPSIWSPCCRCGDRRPGVSVPLSG